MILKRFTNRFYEKFNLLCSTRMLAAARAAPASRLTKFFV